MSWDSTINSAMSHLLENVLRKVERLNMTGQEGAPLARVLRRDLSGDIVDKQRSQLNERMCEREGRKCVKN